jgi:hypothetical protein
MIDHYKVPEFLKDDFFKQVSSIILFKKLIVLMKVGRKEETAS